MGIEASKLPESDPSSPEDVPEPESIGVLRWYLIRLYPFREWICANPFLIVVVSLPLLIVWGWLGSDFGLPMLFWHEHPVPQMIAGLAVGLLVGKVCFIGYLLVANAEWLTRPLPPLVPPRVWTWLAALVPGWLREAIESVPGSLWWYLGATWPWLLALFAARALVPAFGADVFADGFNAVAKWPLLVGLACGPVVALPILLVLYAGRFGVYVGSMKKAQTLPQERVRLHAIAGFVLTLAFALFAVFALTPFGRYATPALALCLLLDVSIAVYGAVVYHRPRWVYPLFFAGLLWLGLANFSDYKLRFPGLDNYYAASSPVLLADYETLLRSRTASQCGLLDSEKDVLEAWLRDYRKRHPESRRPQLRIVAVSGGASRAAFWTALVLTELERQEPGSSADIRLIAGASGGMLGAGYFVAELDELRRQGNDLKKRSSVLDGILQNLQKDHLSPLTRDWIFEDIPLLAWPGNVSSDRGRGLEAAWLANLPRIDRTFRDLAKGEKEGWRPPLVFAPMFVEDGRRLLISNLDLGGLARSQGPRWTDQGHRPRALYSISAVEFFRLFPEAADFKLTTAVRMSASFPYVSPAVALPTRPARRVVDAGYYDNYGVNVAIAWLYRHRAWLERHECDVTLIQIRDSLSRRDNVGPAPDDDDEGVSILARALSEFVTPAQGILQARQATMTFRNDEQVEMWSELVEAGKRVTFTTAVYECPAHVAMSWYLTELEADAMEIGGRNLSVVRAAEGQPTSPTVNPAMQAKLDRLQREDPKKARMAIKTREQNSQVMDQVKRSSGK
jgi:predicted acylesterase/phospholipase RssA